MSVWSALAVAATSLERYAAAVTELRSSDHGKPPGRGPYTTTTNTLLHPILHHYSSSPHKRSLVARYDHEVLGSTYDHATPPACRRLWCPFVGYRAP